MARTQSSRTRSTARRSSSSDIACEVECGVLERCDSASAVSNTTRAIRDARFLAQRAFLGIGRAVVLASLKAHRERVEQIAVYRRAKRNATRPYASPGPTRRNSVTV